MRCTCNLRSATKVFLGYGLVVLAMVTAGCSGLGGADDRAANNNEGLDLFISYDDAPASMLVASARMSDGSEFAIYGTKDPGGQVEQVSQIDLVLEEGGAIASVELDERERPVRIEVDDGSEATFTYDPDTDTVRVEVRQASGADGVDESLDLQSASGALVSTLGSAASITQEDLCTRLGSTQDVLGEFFGCERGGTGVFCEGTLPRVAARLKKLCQLRPVEVEDPSVVLGDEPREIALGIRPHFTTRPAPENGTTAVLVATVFGGVRPYEGIEWSWLSGPEEVPVENLPGGVAVADLPIPGWYKFRAHVTDAEGQQARADVEIVTDSLPEVVIHFEPEHPDVGQVVHFSGADASHLPEDPIVLYHWRFGDGTSAEGMNVRHAYAEQGKYIVTLMISTRAGKRATATTTVRVSQPQDCETLCHVEAEAKFLECLMAGEPEEACAVRSRDFLKHCLREECNEEGDCKDHCRAFARETFEVCLEEGGGEDECEAAAAEALERCMRERCADPPDCEAECHGEAERRFLHCREEGGTKDACMTESRAFLEHCLAEHCEEPPDCEKRCRSLFERIFEECRRNGGNEEECAARAGEQLERCLHEECFEPPDCEGMCREHAGRVLEECLADGGKEEDCEARAREFMEHCVRKECEEPPDCEAVCREHAGDVFRSCRAEGGSEEDCLALKHESLEHCLREECASPPPSCEEICTEEAECIFKQCREAGGNDEECEARFRDVRAHCIREECNAPPDCEQACEEYAHHILEECLVEDGGEDPCEALARETFESCLVAEECGIL